MRRLYRSLRYRPVLGLSLGTTHCRFATSLSAEVVAERTMMWRLRTDKSIYGNGLVFGSARPPCRGWTEREDFCPLAEEEQISPCVLGGILTFFSRFAAYHAICRPVRRLVLTAPPEMMDRIMPLLTEAAAFARIRHWKIVSERDCLARALPLRRDAPTLVVDVGHVATRVYCFGSEGCEPDNARGARCPGWLTMAESITDALYAQHGLIIHGLTVLKAMQEATDKATEYTTYVGRSCATGQPAYVPFRTSATRSLCLPVYKSIKEACETVLSRLSPGIAGGIILTGGAAVAPGLADFLATRCAVPVSLSPDPRSSVVRGLSAMLHDRLALELLR